MQEVVYEVPDIHCEHCREKIEKSVSAVGGVESVEVDRVSGLVTVRGDNVADHHVRTAIEQAGYTAGP